MLDIVFPVRTWPWHEDEEIRERHLLTISSVSSIVLVGASEVEVAVAESPPLKYKCFRPPALMSEGRFKSMGSPSSRLPSLTLSLSSALSTLTWPPCETGRSAGREREADGQTRRPAADEEIQENSKPTSTRTFSYSSEGGDGKQDSNLLVRYDWLKC